MYNQPYILSHQIVSVNKKNAILVKENEQKRRTKNKKQNKQDYTAGTIP
jgi:heme exporter protein D